MKNLRYSFLLLVPLLALVTGACNGESDDGETTAPATSELPDSYWLSAVPEGARDVGAARADLADGATVTVRGVVGGSKKPFVEGMAAFQMVDPALKSCVGDGMGCLTPWDYCCVDPQKIADNSMTVEFRDGDTTLTSGLLGANGLDHLTTVVVQGVAELDAQGNVTIVASGMRAVD